MNGRFGGTEPTPGLAVASSLRTAAGSALPVEVTVTNTATAPRVISVGVLGVEAAWVSPPVQTPALEPGQSAVVTLTLTPAIGTVPAHYPLAFTAQALDPGTGRPTGTSAAMVDSALVVNPRNQMTVTLEPRNVSLISTKKVRLTLTNGGDQPARVSIGVQASPKLLVRFRSQEVDVLPGATREIRGRVRVPHGKLVGSRSTYSYTVSTRGTESVRHVEGSVSQHPLIGPMVFKVLAVLAVLSIWIAAAVVFVPKLSDRLGNDQSETTTATVKKDGSGSDDGSGGSGGGSGSGSGGTGGKGSGGGKGGKGAGGGTQSAADKKASVVALTGTVAGRQPGGVTVSLAPTSLVDEDAQGGLGVGTATPSLGDTGMSLASAFLNRAVAQTPPDRTARTAADGSWGFTDVRQPGFYLLTFSKPGYQSRSFVIDSSSGAAEEPLKVDLAAGEGRLSGDVTGPGGPVGAATVTITDGMNTLTTSSNSRGRVGHWSVSGLSTPGTYVVQVTRSGLSTESRMVELAAGGSAVADLQLRRGVATLFGKVRAVDESGAWNGVGGAQVTVASEDGTIRTATTLTQGERSPGSTARTVADFVGTYAVPGLKVPGDYVVTVTGDGLQTQTSKISLDRGQSRASVDADLVSASGSVAGTISGLATTGATAGIVGAGLTLRNAENTYKTMSTSDPAGGYLFNGVVPGSYTLHTEFFGYQSDDVAVTVRAGRAVLVDRQVAQVEGGVLAARSSVHGRTVDGSTALPIGCGGPTVECVVASVFEPGVDDDTGDDHTYKTKFLPTDEFTLPDPLENPGAGLLPGLHSVTVSAPHYSSTVTKVQVAADSTMDLGTVALLPAPKIAGFISTAIGTPRAGAKTCIWALPPSAAGPPPAGCDTAGGGGTPGTSAECQPTDATFGLGDTGRVCASVEGTGRYSIEVPAGGTWTLYIETADPEYLVPAAVPILLEPGVTRNQSYVLNRLGRLTFTVVAPNTSGVVAALAGAEITLDPTAGSGVTTDPASGKTGADGVLQMFSVPPGTYDADARLGDTLGTREDIKVGLNQQVDVRITATEPIPSVIGQVTYNLDGTATPVPGATVQVTAPTNYNDNGSPVQETVSMTATTVDPQGCFIIERSGSASPVVPGRGDCSWDATSGSDSSRGKKTFVSNVANRVVVSRTGFTTLTQATPTLSTDALNSYTLEPLPVALGVVRPTITTGRVPPPPVDWSTVTFTVEPKNGPSTPIKVTGTGVGAAGQLSWFDTRINVRDRVLAGTYTVRAHLDGFRDGQGTVFCDPVVGTCGWKTGQTLTLTELSALHVTATFGGTGVDGAQYTLRTDGGSPVRLDGDASGVTFTGLDPSGHVYTVDIRVAGFAFTPTLACPTSATIALSAGLTTQCTAALQKLGTVTGRVKGSPEKPPGTLTETNLVDADVSIYKCTDTTTYPGECAAIEAAPSFTGTTDGSGNFTITGDTTKAGLNESTAWLVQASAPGYSLATPASGAKPGVLVTSFTAHQATANIALVLTPVAISVTLREAGFDFTDATVELWRYTSTGSERVKTATVGTTSYSLTGITPGSYYVLAYGGGLITATQDVLVETDGQKVTMPVVRAANTAQGTITASDISGDGALVGAHITFCKATPCTTPVTGTNRLAATTDSGAAGFFVLRTVPDGSLYMKVDQTGYQTQTLGPFTFDHLLGPISPINVRLEPVVHKVQITVKRTWSNNDLSTATVKLDNGGLPISPDVFALSGGDYVATFNQVKWGCWTVTLGLPADHYGVQGPLTGGPTDTNVTGCTGPKQLVVPTTEGTAPATASMVLDEGRVDVTVAATARADFPGHVAPASVQLLITKSGTPGWTIPFTVGSRTLWLPPGSGYAMTARRLPVDAFWPDDTKTAITVPAAKPTADAVLVPLALTEGAATLTVKLTGQRLDSNTLVLTPPTTESVPTSFSTAAFTADSTSFDLPKGVWTVKAISTKSVTDPDTGVVTVTTKEDTGSATITGPGPTSVTLNLH